MTTRTGAAHGARGAGRVRRNVLRALAIPVLLLLAWSLVVRPEPASLLVPLFGPWAGVLCGHWDCTLGSGHPWAIAASAGGIVLVGTFGLRRGGIARALAGVLLALLVLAWLAAAFLSVANTLF